MIGCCSHCTKPGLVWRYRIWTVGLRFMDRACADRLAAMGLVIEPVTIAEPREENLGVTARRIPSVGMRMGLRWLRWPKAAA